ncbi:MAG: serine hydrolase domain-containing protein [Flavobacteriaceae bacterium]|tara:strand:+ start:432 stop:1910 length:1479 start_codon:yes stop_codon:yes gene_type:complete
MKKYFFIIVSILFLNCNNPSIDSEKSKLENLDSKNYSDVYKMVEIWLQSEIDYDNIPGFSVAIINKDKIDWSKAIGNEKNKDKISINSLFSICSISKLFTSIGIMQLVNEGKINLDDPLEMHLPFFDLVQIYPESSPITIKNVLTHSSGLPRESNQPYWSNTDLIFPTKEEVIEGLSKQKTLYPANRYFQYSNLGLTLLGYLIEEVSGIPYNQYISDKILNPLGMNSTKTFMDSEQYGDELIIGFGAENRKNKREIVPYFNAFGIDPAAGFSSNTSDLAKFAIWQLNLLSGKNDLNILPENLLTQMHQIQFSDNLIDVKRGLGFNIYETKNDILDRSEVLVGHGGSCPGYKTQLTIDPEGKKAFIVLINARGVTPSKYTRGIKNLMDQLKQKNNKKSNLFDEISGYYKSLPWNTETYLSSWGENIALISLPTNSANITRFKPIEKDVFRRILKNNDLGEYLYILRDEKNSIIGFKRHQNIYNFYGKEASDLN